MQLGLLRSDYLFHTAGNRLSPKQVQFNTISFSFDLLSERPADMHRHTIASTSYLSISSYLIADNFPEKITTSVLAEGLAQAHDASYYRARFLLERIHAIKCPPPPSQPAGGSEVREALARPGILEHFLGNKSAIWGADAIGLTAYATDIRGTWMRMWALDSEDADIIAVLDYLQSDLPNSGQEGEPPETRLARIKAQ
ncbi:hypothetical protein M405DRAFT_868729 [Rhizopogon salebrosus TDB-379]|nr:hypothetical protein M405DRAFT_868729 [Rhizopogon salebrosus TDB-379]